MFKTGRGKWPKLWIPLAPTSGGFVRSASTLGVVLTAIMAVAAPQACQARQAEVPGATGPVADSIRSFAFRMVGLLRARDTEGVLALYGDRSTFVHVEDGVARTWPELERGIRQYFARVTENPISVVGKPGVVLLGPDAAVLYVVHRLEDRPGAPGHEGIWTGVLRREGGDWRIVHSHSSDP